MMDARARRIIRDSGAGEKGQAVAVAILEAADKVFSGVDQRFSPWAVAELAAAIFRSKAAEVFAARHMDEQKAKETP